MNRRYAGNSEARPVLERLRSDDTAHEPGFRMEDERWRPIPSYAAWYEASASGLICSLARPGTSGGLLVPQLNSRGYWVVILCRYGTCQMHTVARLILLTFAGPANGRRVRFGPGGPRDCSLANLSWG